MASTLHSAAHCAMAVLLTCALVDAQQQQAPSKLQTTPPQAAVSATSEDIPTDAATASTVPSPLLPGLSDYSGNLDSKAVHFTFVAKPGGAVDGSYFLNSDLQDYPFHGKFIDTSSLSARIQSASGGVAYLYLKVDKSKTSTACLTGALYEGSGSHQQSVAICLKFSDSAVTSEVDRYAVAGAKDRATVESTAQAFWLDVTTGRPAEAAARVAYPLAYTENGRRTLLHNGSEFEKKFPVIFTPAYVSELKSFVPKAMVANDRGIVLGTGQVLFGPDGRAFALNNESVRMFAGKKFLSNAGWGKIRAGK